MNTSALLAAFEPLVAIFFVMRIAAGIGGAVVGWFVSGPVFGLLFRLVFQRSMPAGLMPWLRLAGAAAIGLLVFYFLPLGGGPGWGPGGGGGAGPGPGEGNGQINRDKVVKDDKPKDQPDKDKKVTGKIERERIEIELLGGGRPVKDGKYYLLRRKTPPVSLDEVEAFFKDHKDPLEVHIILTDDNSVGRHHGAVSRLQTLANHYQIPATIEPADQE